MKVGAVLRGIHIFAPFAVLVFRVLSYIDNIQIDFFMSLHYRRVSSWGGSLGSIGIDYLKAIGIRIHVVRFQQKSKDFFSATAASGTISRSSNKSTDSKSKRSETVGKSTLHTAHCLSTSKSSTLHSIFLV